MSTFGWLMISRLILALAVLSTGWITLQVLLGQAAATPLAPAAALVLIAWYAHCSCRYKHRRTEESEEMAMDKQRQALHTGLTKPGRHLRLVPRPDED